MRALYEFGQCRLDPAKRILTRHGVVVPLPPKAFDLLLLMVQTDGRALSRAELTGALWPDTVVEEANLSFQVSTLRKALGEEGSGWIETLPRHGYRFAAEVRTIAPDRKASPALREDNSSRSRGGRRQWPTALVAVVGTAIIAYVVFLAWGGAGWDRSSSSEPSPPVPLTSYPGFQRHPSLSPDGSQVAFAWNGTSQDNSDIYVKLVGPGAPIRLTTDPAPDRTPAWSPDGRQIAFMRFGSENRASVLVIPALGGRERRLADIDVVITPNPAAPSPRNLSWSPDGRWVAVGGRFEDDEAAGIWLVPVDGGPPRRLTHAGGASWSGDIAPVFSRTGDSLVFLRYQSHSPGGVLVQRLADDLAPEGEPARLVCEASPQGGPAWTPGGGGVVFSSGPARGLSRLQRIEMGSASPDECGESQALPFGELATAVSVSRNGRLVYERFMRDAEIWRLRLPLSPQDTADPVRFVSSAFDDHTPAYSPDGRRVAFASTRSGTEEIWTARADGTNPVQLTSMGGIQAANPSWSPDGRMILFDSRREGSADLFLVDLGSGSLRQLTDWPEWEGEASWSRDGSWVYFGSNRTGRNEVWKRPVDGGVAVQITRKGGMTPRESPDGRWLYYAKDLGVSTQIWRVSPSGGDENRIVDGLSYPSNFAVAESGIYFLAQRPGVEDHSIDFHDLSSGTTRSILRTARPWWYGMAISPDGRTLLYSAVQHAGSHLMLVEDFQ